MIFKDFRITSKFRTQIEEKINLELFGRGFAWLDTGTYDDLLEAGKYIATIESRQGLKIGCIEEIAYRMGFINKEELLKIAEKYNKNNYGEYLRKVSEKQNDFRLTHDAQIQKKKTHPQ